MAKQNVLEKSKIKLLAIRMAMIKAIGHKTKQLDTIDNCYLGVEQ